MNIQTICMGVCSTNCYIVSDDNKNVVIFDVCDMGEGLWDFLESKELKPCAVIITHAHIDHIYGLCNFMERAEESGSDIKVYIHKDDAKAMCNSRLNLSSLIVGEEFKYGKAMYEVDDGDIIEAGSLRFKVLSTPGHTPGSACFLEESENTLFSGDTLFSSSIGRVDFPGGSVSDMRKSLDRLMELPNDCKVYPGHGESTTIGVEKRLNRFI